MKSEDLSTTRDAFRLRFEIETDQIKKQVHYQSVLNMSEALLKIKNKRESKEHKQTLYNYFQKVSSMNFPLDKVSSLTLWHEYLFPLSLYLMTKADFTSSADLQRNFLWGILCDLVVGGLFFFQLGLYFPLFTLFFVIRAHRKRNNSIKNNKYFGVNY